MNKQEYQQYLKSEDWQRRRKWFLIFWNYRCALCNSDKAAHVHHRTYERIGYELLSDCVVLCNDCHTRHSVVLQPDEKMFAFWTNVYAELEAEGVAV